MTGRVDYAGVFRLSYLERSGSVGLFPAEVDLPGNGQTHEEPVAKAVVVDELEDILHCQVDQWHDALDSGRRKKGWENKKTVKDVSDLKMLQYSLQYEDSSIFTS